MTARKILRFAALALVAGGVSTSAVVAWKRYGRLDPYASLLRRMERQRDASAAIRADGVKIRHYQNGKLVASAEADGLTIDQNRDGVALRNVRNGVAQTPKGPMQFAAKKGVLRPNRRSVDVSGGVRVSGKDFDIQTSRATIDGVKGEVRAPEPLSGTIGGGRFTAASLVHQPNADYTHLKAISWVGKPPKGLAIPASAQDRVWNMASADSERRGLKETHMDARAQDSEVIVMAPKIERDLKTDVLVATGRVTYRSAKADVVADKVVVYRKEGRAEFTGNVVMLVRAKKDWEKPLPKIDEDARPAMPTLPAGLQAQAMTNIPLDEKKRDDELRSGKTLREYPMNMTAEAVTYWYRKGDRHAVAKGGEPTAWQKFDDGRWRQVWAPTALYDGEKDMLDLKGDGATRDVKMKNSIGEWMDATAVTLSTKEDQTEEDEYVKAKNAKAVTVDRGDPDDPRNGQTPPATKTIPTPAKTTP